MSVNRFSKSSGGGPAHSQKIIYQTWRGKLYAKSWPRKQTGKERAKKKQQEDWFRQANMLAKWTPAPMMQMAQMMTKDSGWYPRDVIMSAMAGQLYGVLKAGNRKLYPMTVVRQISETLDALGQNVGTLLQRTAEGWRALEPGPHGRVLTSQGEGEPPVWAVPAGGATGGLTLVDAIDIDAHQSLNEWNDLGVPTAWNTLIFRSFRQQHPDAMNLKLRFNDDARSVYLRYAGEGSGAGSNQTTDGVILQANSSHSAGNPHTAELHLHRNPVSHEIHARWSVWSGTDVMLWHLATYQNPDEATLSTINVTSAFGAGLREGMRLELWAA